jgi:DNA gyrase subunit A
MKEIARLEEILAEDLIKGIIRDEFDEILENYGDERRTDIVASC